MVTFPPVPLRHFPKFAAEFRHVPTGRWAEFRHVPTGRWTENKQYRHYRIAGMQIRRLQGKYQLADFLNVSSSLYFRSLLLVERKD